MKENVKKEDLRIRRTYKLLFDSLLALLAEKNFDDISVTDICEKAMIHRTTFYKHFEDKYELLKFCIKRFQNMFLESTEDNLESDLAQYYLKSIQNILKFITSDNNKNHFSALLKNNSNSISSIFHQLIIEDLILNLELFEKQGMKLSVPIPIIAEFYGGATISVIKWWLESENPISIDKLMEYAEKLVRNCKDLIIT